MLKLFISILALYFIALLFFYLIQRNLIYFPDHISPTPEEAGVPEMEVITLQTEDGLSLHAWYHPPQTPRPTVVYFHGNASHIGLRAPIIKPFLDEGYGVLLLTYRGYSGNPGKPHEQGLYADARAAMEFLKKQGISDDCIALYGNSIGGAVAIQMATEYPVGALILQSPFTSLGELGQHHFPIFPTKWLLKDQYNNREKIERIHVPILVIQGEEDRIVPPIFSRRLFHALSDPKELHSIPGKGHNDLFEPALVLAFIRKWTKC